MAASCEVDERRSRRRRRPRSGTAACARPGPAVIGDRRRSRRSAARSRPRRMTASSRWRIAALRLPRLSGGVWSSGSSSVLTGPPRAQVAVRGETLRDEPAHARLAGGGQEVSVPSVRSRLVWAKVRSTLLREAASASAVAWWTMASGLASRTTAARTARASSSPARPVRRRARAAARPCRVSGNGADHLVALFAQPRDEPGADRAAGSDDQNSHDLLLILACFAMSHPPCSAGLNSRTPGDPGM